MPFPAWPDVSPDELERELLATWGKERLFERTLERTKGNAHFVFYEGPPTANGRPGIHHVFARTHQGPDLPLPRRCRAGT